ncbi:hypothetical protein ACIOD2_37655 [Amycolatopsis sp. NPDC088138]|uniref:hypothetical protein n=1 Tax=Amycolatopsis sp. NPDC088138 TaxID=3363938 RepID=UPI003810D30D
MTTPKALDRIVRRLGEPTVPPLPVDWEIVEATLGTALPSDYKEYCARYPAAVFDENLRVDHPTCSDDFYNLLSGAVGRTAAVRQLTAEFPVLYEYPVYPDPGGLLCWGNTTGRVQCYWLTEGPPDSWKVVIDEEIPVVFDGNFTETLADILDGNLPEEIEPLHCPLDRLYYIQ